MIPPLPAHLSRPTWPKPRIEQIKMPESRTSILKRFRDKIARGEAIIGGCAGPGNTAKGAEAGWMTEAGADIVVAHMGLTTGGTIGAQTARTLDEAVEAVEEIATTCKAIRGDVIVLCHGGPISMPEDARYILDNCPQVDGFYG